MSDAITKPLTGTLYLVPAPLDFGCRTLLFGKRRADLPAHDARGAQFALLAIQPRAAIMFSTQTWLVAMVR